MTVPLSTPFALGATGVQNSARVDRLALGASFRRSTSAVQAVSGILYGPAGTMGELTLVSDTLLRVAPFIAEIQGTHATNQGQYVVPNDAQRDLAVPAKDASQFRKALIVVRVADSLSAGVVSSATTDGSWLEIVSGALAASNPALPALPANALALGELTIPSSGSGQPVTLTPYNPRTTTRGGILPVFDDALTTPGHGGELGTYVGQYRDHPLYGLQRWNGTRWHSVGGGHVSATPLGVTIGSGGVHGLTVANFQAAAVGQQILAIFSAKVHFGGASQQTFQVGMHGSTTGATYAEGDLDHFDRTPGAPGSGDHQYLVVRHILLTATALTVNLALQFVVGLGGSNVSVYNPRCFIFSNFSHTPI